MKLITWNIYGLFLEGLNLGERVHRVGQALDGTKADVVNLQEVFLSNTLEIIRAEMHNAFQATFYRRFFLFTAAGLVTFSKLRPLSKELVAFHSTSPGFPGWDFPKGALLSEFRDYYLVNCHVPLNRSFNWNRRENYAEQTSAINLLTSVLTQVFLSDAKLHVLHEYQPGGAQREQACQYRASQVFAGMHKQCVVITCTQNAAQAPDRNFSAFWHAGRPGEFQLFRPAADFRIGSCDERYRITTFAQPLGHAHDIEFKAACGSRRAVVGDRCMHRYG